jgi:ankyrin repeat protein
MEKRLPGGNGTDNARPRFEHARAQAMGGMTALLFAARDGQMDAAKALLEGGADINQVSGADKTSPLVEAILNGHFDLARFFVNWGADPNVANEIGLTPLYATVDVQWAPKSWFPQPITAEETTTYLDLMKALLDDGADPNAKLGKKLWFRTFGDHSWVDTAGATAFWRAAQSTDLAAMRLLVERGADPNLPSAAGDSPLMVASGIGWGANFSVTASSEAGDAWIEAAKYCVRLGADVNTADERGYTALHGAAYIGDNDLIQFLVDKGADVKAVAKDKNTVADMANGPTRFGIPHPETMAFVEKLGSANSHNCRSDQCLVAPQPDRRRGAPATESDAKPQKPGGNQH